MEICKQQAPRHFSSRAIFVQQLWWCLCPPVPPLPFATISVLYPGPLGRERCERLPAPEFGPIVARTSQGERTHLLSLAGSLSREAQRRIWIHHMETQLRGHGHGLLSKEYPVPLGGGRGQGLHGQSSSGTG